MRVHNKCFWCNSDLPKAQNKYNAFCDWTCKRAWLAREKKAAKNAKTDRRQTSKPKREPIMRKVSNGHGTMWIQSPLWNEDE